MKRKGTDAFTVSQGDAAATARTSLAYNRGEAVTPSGVAPIWPFTHAEALAYYDTQCPGGEFNGMMADDAIETHRI